MIRTCPKVWRAHLLPEKDGDKARSEGSRNQSEAIELCALKVMLPTPGQQPSLQLTQVTAHIGSSFFRHCHSSLGSDRGKSWIVGVHGQRGFLAVLSGAPYQPPAVAAAATTASSASIRFRPSSFAWPRAASALPTRIAASRS